MEFQQRRSNTSYDLMVVSMWQMLSRVQLNQQTGSAVIRPTHKPCWAPPRKIPFLNSE